VNKEVTLYLRALKKLANPKGSYSQRMLGPHYKISLMIPDVFGINQTIILTIPSSPSDRRWRHNALAKFRRILRKNNINLNDVFGDNR